MSDTHFRARLLTVATLLVCLLATACKRDKRFKPTYPVTGKILFEGKPAAGANVALIPLNPDEPLDNWARPSGEVMDDGSFTIMTYKIGDGAPAGEYALTVCWVPPLPPSTSDPPPIDMEKVNKLPMRYLTREGSAAKVTVKNKPVDLGEINLTK